MTISLVNETQSSLEDLGEKSLFQSRFSIFPQTEGQLLPYYENTPSGDDEDVEKMNLLYRKERSFSIGHGCTGDWDAKEWAEFAEAIHAEPLPTTETPSFTPMLETSQEKKLRYALHHWLDSILRMMVLIFLIYWSTNMRTGLNL